MINKNRKIATKYDQKLVVSIDVVVNARFRTYDLFDKQMTMLELEEEQLDAKFQIGNFV